MRIITGQVPASGGHTVAVAIPPFRATMIRGADGSCYTLGEFAAKIAPVELVVGGQRIEPEKVRRLLIDPPGVGTLTMFFDAPLALPASSAAKRLAARMRALRPPTPFPKRPMQPIA